MQRFKECFGMTHSIASVKGIRVIYSFLHVEFIYDKQVCIDKLALR